MVLPQRSVTRKVSLCVGACGMLLVLVWCLYVGCWLYYVVGCAVLVLVMLYVLCCSAVLCCGAVLCCVVLVCVVHTLMRI